VEVLGAPVVGVGDPGEAAGIELADDEESTRQCHALAGQRGLHAQAGPAEVQVATPPDAGADAGPSQELGSQRVAIIAAGGSGMGADAARRLSADGFRIGILSSSGKGEALGESLGGFGVTGSNRSTEALQRLTVPA